MDRRPGRCAGTRPALGLIHRDVKPSNVLIDADDRVYLTDFGLAKGDGGAATLTLDGQVDRHARLHGAEQAGGGKSPLDAPTDVYGLGVILYELLTGARPFVGAGPMLLARIREEEPRPPRRLDLSIPRDLETVCLKAMAKEPGRRYATAADLAADLRRWLRGEPVLARPAGPLGTLWRRCRRRPVVSGLSASLILAILVGFIGVTREWRRAEAFRRRAEANLAGMKAQRDRATRALEQGQRSLWTLNRLAISGQLAHLEPPYSREVQTLLFEQYRAYRRESITDPLMRLELANAAFHIARLLEGQAPQPEALAAWREAHELHENLARDEPDNIPILNRFGDFLVNQSLFLRRAGRIEEGQELLQQAAGQMRRARRARQGQPGAGPREPRDPKVRGRLRAALGCTELDLGNIPEAMAVFRRSGELAEANLRSGLAEEEEFARAILGFAFLQLSRLVREGRSAEGIADDERLSRWSESLRREGVLSVSSTIERARLAFSIGGEEDRADRVLDALRDLRHAADLFEQLDREGGLAPSDRSTLAVAHHIIGRLCTDNGRAAEAVDSLRRAVSIREAIVRENPEDLHLRCDCVGSWYRLGEALEHTGRIPEAVEAYRKCVAHQREVYARDHWEIKHRNFLDERLRQLFRLLLALGRPGEALEIARERRALWPDDPAVALSTAGELAAVLVRRGEPLLVMAWTPERRRSVVEVLAAWRDAADRVAEVALHRRPERLPFPTPRRRPAVGAPGFDARMRSIRL